MNELYHYNHNHDPRNGQFTSGNGYIGSGGSGRNGRITKKDRKKALLERKKTQKNVRNLTDEELQRRIERLNLERAYKTLSEADVSPGKKYATELLKMAGKNAVQTATPRITASLIDAMIKKRQQ